MPNSKEHRLSNINRPNTISNPSSYMHLDYSNPLGSRNFRSIIRGSSTGYYSGITNRQDSNIRDLTRQTRRIYERSKGEMKKYKIIHDEVKREEALARIPKIMNSNPLHYLVVDSLYKDDDIYATDTRGGVHYYGGVDSGGWLVTGSIDMTSRGVYNLFYKFVDPYNGNFISTQRRIHVTDAPMFVLNGIMSETIYIGNSWIDPGYTVTQPGIPSGRVVISVSSQLPRDNIYSTVGTYNINYTLSYPGLFGTAIPLPITLRRVLYVVDNARAHSVFDVEGYADMGDGSGVRRVWGSNLAKQGTENTFKLKFDTGLAVANLNKLKAESSLILSPLVSIIEDGVQTDILLSSSKVSIVSRSEIDVKYTAGTMVQELRIRLMRVVGIIDDGSGYIEFVIGSNKIYPTINRVTEDYKWKLRTGSTMYTLFDDEVKRTSGHTTSSVVNGRKIYSIPGWNSGTESPSTLQLKSTITSKIGKNDTGFTVLFWLYVHFDEDDYANRDTNGKGAKCSIFGNKWYNDSTPGFALHTDWTNRWTDIKNNKTFVTLLPMITNSSSLEYYGNRQWGRVTADGNRHQETDHVPGTSCVRFQTNKWIHIAIRGKHSDDSNTLEIQTDIENTIHSSLSDILSSNDFMFGTTVGIQASHRYTDAFDVQNAEFYDYYLSDSDITEKYELFCKANKPSGIDTVIATSLSFFETLSLKSNSGHSDAKNITKLNNNRDVIVENIVHILNDTTMLQRYVNIIKVFEGSSGSGPLFTKERANIIAQVYEGLVASGLKWVSIGSTRPSSGKEIEDTALKSALKHKSTFTQEEWEQFGINDLRTHHFIKSGYNVYFKPDGAIEDDGRFFRRMLDIMQVFFDQGMTLSMMWRNRTIYDKFLFEHSSVFHGSVARPAYERYIEETVNVRLDDYWGRAKLWTHSPVVRATGIYIVAGGYARIEVPDALINQNIVIQIGTHPNDHAQQSGPSNGKHTRLDRTVHFYMIQDKITQVYTPLGGGIYIRVPLKTNFGHHKIKVQGQIVNGAMYRHCPEQSLVTTKSEWDKVWSYQGPWFDLETDKYFMQVPMEWLRVWKSAGLIDYSKQENMMYLVEAWNHTMDGMSEWAGYRLKRHKYTMWMQVDANKPMKNFSIGYPMCNASQYYQGDLQKIQITGLNYVPYFMNYMNVYTNTTDIHECGHEHVVFMFGEDGNKGEESIIEVANVYIGNVKFGDSMLSATRHASGLYKMLWDDPMIDWVSTSDFRNNSTTHARMTEGQKKYQPRGWQVYSEIACMFGWDVWRNYNTRVNTEADADRRAGRPQHDRWEPTDDRIYNFSVHADADLRPFFHIWGEPPKNAAVLAQRISSKGLHQCAGMNARILYYKSIVPKDHATFLAHFGRMRDDPMLYTWTRAMHDEVVAALEYVRSLYITSPTQKAGCPCCGLISRHGFKYPIPQQRILQKYRTPAFTIVNPSLLEDACVFRLTSGFKNDLLLNFVYDFRYGKLCPEIFEEYSPTKMLSIYGVNVGVITLLKQYEVTDLSMSIASRQITLQDVVLNTSLDCDIKFRIENTYLFNGGMTEVTVSKKNIYPRIPLVLTSENVMRYIHSYGSVEVATWAEFDRTLSKYTFVSKNGKNKNAIQITEDLLKLIGSSFTITLKFKILGKARNNGETNLLENGNTGSYSSERVQLQTWRVYETVAGVDYMILRCVPAGLNSGGGFVFKEHKIDKIAVNEEHFVSIRYDSTSKKNYFDVYRTRDQSWTSRRSSVQSGAEFPLDKTMKLLVGGPQEDCEISEVTLHQGSLLDSDSFYSSS